jgi:hypothetical protein
VFGYLKIMTIFAPNLTNKYIIYGDVWVQEINNKLNEVNIQYKWCYEKGNLTYYITQE